MKRPFYVPGALVVVKGLNLETFPLAYSYTPEVSPFNQTESRWLVNGAVKRKRFQGERFYR